MEDFQGGLSQSQDLPYLIRRACKTEKQREWVNILMPHPQTQPAPSMQGFRHAAQADAQGKIYLLTDAYALCCRGFTST